MPPSLEKRRNASRCGEPACSAAFLIPPVVHEGETNGLLSSSAAVGEDSGHESFVDARRVGRGRESKHRRNQMKRFPHDPFVGALFAIIVTRSISPGFSQD